MPEILNSARFFNLIASNTQTATFNTATFQLPAGDGYAFVLDVTAASGTTETLDMALQITPDGGTTWYDWARFAQVTTSAVTRRLVIQPLQGRGEAGSEAAITAGGTGAINANVPLPSAPNNCRFRGTISGTSPSYTFAVQLAVSPRATAV